MARQFLRGIQHVRKPRFAVGTGDGGGERGLQRIEPLADRAGTVRCADRGFGRGVEGGDAPFAFGPGLAIRLSDRSTRSVRRVTPVMATPVAVAPAPRADSAISRRP